MQVSSFGGMLLAGLAVLPSGCAAPRTAKTDLQTLLRGGIGPVRAADVRHLREELLAIERRGGDSEVVALAIDTLAEIDAMRPYPNDVSRCSKGSQDRYQESEEDFARGRRAEARSKLEHAMQACPDSAVMRTSYGAFFLTSGDTARADAELRAAIRIDPWNRAAHRMLSEIEAASGRAQQAYQQALLAVMSDPTSEMSWRTLRLRMRRPAAMRRVRMRKPAEAVVGTNNILFDPDAAGDDGPVWMAYAIGKLGGPTDSVFEHERSGVEAALGVYGNGNGTAAAGAAAPSPFWEMLRMAKDRGYLDVAVYVHFLTPAMADEYAAFRAANRDRISDYLRGLAPFDAV